jgi:type I restriction-modification system DNA methylase subunit
VTREEIQNTLRQEYDRQRWLQILRVILPGTDVFGSPQALPISIPTAPQAVQLARVRLGDRKQLAVLEVTVGDRIDLLRNRVGLRNLVARFIDQAEYHGVLAVFLAPQSDFRFTFAARMAEFDDEGNLLRRETAPRRYTYVLGPNESCRTAADRFLQLSGKGLNGTMQDVIEAFSVEKLNKEFFADFSTAFERVKSEIQKRNRWVEKIAKEEAQTLLNRLLFLYFVQRKGWLNRHRDYLFRNFSRFAADAPNKTTFLDGFLRPLFTKLSTEGSHADMPGHDLPFLNGGLFADEYGDEQHDEVVRRHRELQVSNEVFRSVFDDLLERYNFTIQEDSPTNYEVAIDPEMLGQIFEELVLTSEESETAGKSKRHDTGSHYTRRPIVHYLCRDSLAAWLEQSPPSVGQASQPASAPGTPPADSARPSDGRGARGEGTPHSALPTPHSDDWPQRVRKLLAFDATEGLDDETRAALKDILTPEQAAVVLERLFELRACDPAVGSGAFPMGLLHELLNLARLCATRAAGKDPVLGDRSWLYNTKKRIIERVIYGVDIQPQAVEICKLRLWLSLMVDYEMSADPDNCEATSFRRALKEIEPLPNLDFKIRRANSLVDYIHGEPVELKQLSSETGAEHALHKLSSAKREFFNARTAAAKRKLRLTIYQSITELAKIELTRARMDAAGLGFALTDRDNERVAELDNGLKEIAFIAAQLRDARKMRAQEQENALERIRAQFDDPIKPTFVWQLDFAEVFHREETPHGDSLLPPEKPANGGAATTRNGFDLLIGNPPYVRIQTLKKTAPELVNYYKQRYKRSAGKGNYDLYVVFVERSLELLHQNGQLAFILPHSFFNAEYGEPLRTLLAEEKHVRHIVYFGQHQIFPKATNYVCLLFLAKSGMPSFDFQRVDSFEAWLDTHEGTRGTLPAGQLSSGEWNIVVGQDAGLFERLLKFPTKLGTIADMFVGLQTSADTVFLFKDTKKSKKETTRVFSKELDREVEIESALLKPVVRSGDIGRFWAKANALLLFPYKLVGGKNILISEKELREKYTKTWRYLSDNKGLLEGREHGKFAGPGWFQLYPKNLDVWEQPKVMLPYMVTQLSAWFDEGASYFVNVTTGGFGLTISNPRFNPKFITALLNSSVEDWLLKKVSRTFRGGYFGANKQFLVQLPVPETTEHEQALAATLGGYVQTLRNPADTDPLSPQDSLVASYFEQWVNALVYELFFPQELHGAGFNFFDLVRAEGLPQLDKLPQSERLSVLRGLFQTTYASDHKMRQALYRLGSLDLIRTIEGKA